MASEDRGTMTAGKLVKEFKAVFVEALVDQVSDLNFAPLLLDSGFFAIRNPTDQELFFATSKYLDEFLISAIPQTVDFDESRLALWAKEALDFARNNVEHSSFVEIFSSRIQYEPLIQGLLRFDASGHFLRDYFSQIRVDSAYIGEVLPGSFQAAVQSAARAAILPTLTTISHYLKNYAKLGSSRSKAKIADVTALRRSSSFLNERGSIPFSEVNGRFKIQQSSELEQIAQYKPVVDRSIRKLADARVLQRIDNKDKVLAELLSEYQNVVCRPSDQISVPILWTIGLEIENRIRRQESLTTVDEMIDEDDLFDLRRLMLSHNLLLNCFSQSKALLEHIESSAAIYNRIDAATKNLPSTVLGMAAEDTDLVEPKTGDLIKRTLKKSPNQNVPETKGQIALRLSLLRGLLHAAGGHVLKGIEKVISKTAVDISAKALVETLKADGTFAAIIAFLAHHSSSLFDLSNQAPIYFGYVRGILTMLGL